MQPIEIILIVFCVLVVGGVILSAILRRKSGKGCSGDCSCCSSCRNKNKKLDE